jgi:hypothetical protein
VLLEQPTQQYPKRPGLREIKQVKLWKKYRPLVPEEYHKECCPMPTKAILDGEKNRKYLKSKQKRDAKKIKEGKLKPAPSPQTVAAQPVVAATTARTDSNNESAPPSLSKQSQEDAGLK